MKALNTQTTGKKIISFLLLAGIFFFSSSCDTIISNVSELPEDPDEEANNPNDPNGGTFNLPGIQLITNNYSLDTPFTVTQSEFDLAWEIVDNQGFGIDFEYTFQVRVASPSEELEQQDFFDLGTDQSVRFINLIETFGEETYEYEIEATYNAGTSSRDTSFFGNFYVDTFQQRGFLFSPGSITPNNDGTFTAMVYLDEIQPSDDLTAFSLVVNYSGSQFSVSEDDIQLMDDSGSFLNSSGVDEVIWFTEINNSTIKIDVGLAGNNMQPLAGGGAVCAITFTPTFNFTGSSTIGISSNSVLKTSTGKDIQIEAYDQAILTEE